MCQETPNWEYVDIYADEGKTGTRQDVRDEFNRMIRDAEDGLMDTMEDKVTEIDTPLIRTIIERYEVVSKKKMVIWFIGDIPYEVELPEM